MGNDNKDSKLQSYAAVASSTPDNQPEGSMATPSAPPPEYSAVAKPPQQQQQHLQQQPRRHNHGVHWAQSPGQVERGAVIVMTGSQRTPEYYYAVSRARRRFFGALFWAFIIYLVAGFVLGAVSVTVITH